MESYQHRDVKTKAVRYDADKFKQATNTGDRPIRSESGAATNGPIPLPSSQIETKGVWYRSFRTYKVRIICGAAGVMMFVAKMLLWISGRVKSRPQESRNLPYHCH